MLAPGVTVKMALQCKLFSLLITIFFAQSCNAIKCFHCNSANNSACLDLHLKKMNAIIPVVDCARTVQADSQEFFCRKITQTILHVDKTPELRITRGCGWVRHRRGCYTNDNKDHLETVCQCFGDMCNGASTTRHQVAVVLAVVGFFVSRGYV